MKNKLTAYGLEIGKWVLVIYLIFPLVTVINGPIAFTQVVIGEALLIIFIGKMFYDTVIWKFTRQRRAPGQDWLAMAGMMVAIGFILILFFVLFGITLLRYIHSQATATEQQSEAFLLLWRVVG